MIATAATAAAAAFATVALGTAGVAGARVSPLVYALALLPGLAMGARGRPAIALSARDHNRLLLSLSGALVLALLGLGVSRSIDHLDLIAGVLGLAVVPLSLLWPRPGVLRFCLLLSGGVVLATSAEGVGSTWAVAGFVCAGGVALVATCRQASADLPRLRRPPAPRAPHAPHAPHAPAAAAAAVTGQGRRLGAEAAALVVTAGLIALLISALFPPPRHAGRSAASFNNLGRILRRTGGSGKPDPSTLDTVNALDAGAAQGARSNRIVLRITAPRSSLWRFEALPFWDGRSWAPAPTRAARDQPAGDAANDVIGPGVGDADAGGERLTQNVRIEAGIALALVAAPRAVQIKLPPGTDVFPGVNGALRPAPPLAKGDTYSVTSSVVRAGPDRLRAADPLKVTIPADVASADLQLPVVPDRVRGLAAQLTAAAPDGYDKVVALQRWLEANTRQATPAPAVPAGADPVEQFLFVDRAGPPVRAASALAVLLRESGVPARLAIGFLPGRRSVFGGPYVVRDRDSYAWVEVWFPGVGWQAFDATGRVVPTAARPLSLVSRLLALWPVVVVVALAVLAGALWWRRRSATRSTASAQRRWEKGAFARLTSVGARIGRARRGNQTPAEYGEMLSESVLEDTRLADVGRLLTAAAWSGREPTDEVRSWVDNVLDEAELTAARIDAERTPGRRRSRAVSV